MTTVESSYQEAAWSWLQHLHGGGTTPWREWVRQPDKHSDVRLPDARADAQLPGAATLELLRRMAVAWPAEAPGFSDLADVVLARSAPGRGLGRQPLCWPGEIAAPIGPPAVDPTEVPPRELVRGAVGALAELLLASPDGGDLSTPRRRGLIGRSPAFRLDGAPITVAATQLALARSGHREGGRNPRVLVFAVSFDHALQQAWSARVQRGSKAPWPRFVGRWAGRDRLPPSTDLPRLLRRWRDRVGGDRVHLVVLPEQAHGLDPAVALLGLPAPTTPPRRWRALPRPALQPRFGELGAEAVDLARRVNAVLDVRVAGERRDRLTRLLVSGLANDEGGTVGVAVPHEHRAWVSERAARIVGEIRARGYEVHGELDDLMPSFDAGRMRPRIGAVLELAVQTCVSQARMNQEMPRTRGSVR